MQSKNVRAEKKHKLRNPVSSVLTKAYHEQVSSTTNPGCYFFQQAAQHHLLVKVPPIVILRRVMKVIIKPLYKNTNISPVAHI
ncbi:hypothetical protein HanIR_Chr04g0202321 [Helianthus annuus]|nr:hypothetical protein HanIR_Chr04g0202321 [Helianthus annuus]